jgi:hypothetical protein
MIRLLFKLLSLSSPFIIIFIASPIISSESNQRRIKDFDWLNI